MTSIEIRCPNCGQPMPCETIGQRFARERVVVVDPVVNLIRVYGRPDVTLQARKESGLTVIQTAEYLKRTLADMIDEAVSEATAYQAQEKKEQTDEDQTSLETPQGDAVVEQGLAGKASQVYPTTSMGSRTTACTKGDLVNLDACHSRYPKTEAGDRPAEGVQRVQEVAS